MALSRSLFTGVSGLRGYQTYLDLIGNNIANVNTVGYKSGRMTFKELFALQLRGATRPGSGSGGTNPVQLGLGSDIASVDTLFSQGTLESTGQITDLAIQGDAFFIVKDNIRTFYTRAGSFQFDATGTLVNPNDGTKVQGQMSNNQGVIPTGTSMSDIVIPFGQKSPAKATTAVSFTGNLNAGEKPKGTILETKGVYAIELAGQSVTGGDTNVQSLLSRSSAVTPVVTKMDGIVANSTTVTILDGIDRNDDNTINADDGFNFTYVATDTSSPFDFNSLQDLVDGINQVFGATGQAALNGQATIAATLANGQITFTPNAAVNANRIGGLSIESTNGNLQRALAAANISVAELGTVASRATDTFSHIATRNDLLTNLRNSDGIALGIAVGNTIDIVGKKNAIDIPAVATPLTVAATSTYGDFLDNIESRFSITSEQDTSAGVTAKDTNGALRIVGNGGTDNEISAMGISITNNETFNAIFDSRPNNYSEVQQAADVQASATATVFDSLGQEQVVTLTFTKDATALNTWNFSIAVQEPAELGGGSTGTVTFNTDGSLARFQHTGATQFFTFDPKSGASVPTSITIDSGTVGGFDGITQLGSTSSIVASGQDGFGLGELDSIAIDQEGRITGAFTNGVNQLLAQLTLAQFNNPAGLTRVGNNNFVISANSGDAITGQAGTSFKDTVITPGALEQSNVDLATEFTNMIVAQRGFQANARIISVSDQLLTEIVELKR